MSEGCDVPGDDVSTRDWLRNSSGFGFAVMHGAKEADGMTPLEKAAIAAREAYGATCGETWKPWSKAAPAKRAEWIAMTRAVLMAVRSEGPETWDAGVPVHFTAMIDTILNEEPK